MPARSSFFAENATPGAAAAGMIPVFAATMPSAIAMIIGLTPGSAAPMAYDAPAAARQMSRPGPTLRAHAARRVRPAAPELGVGAAAAAAVAWSGVGEGVLVAGLETESFTPNIFLSSAGLQ
ncbi:hypothetical protein GCM10020360_17040 [Nonlabens tegetincola]